MKKEIIIMMLLCSLIVFLSGCESEAAKQMKASAHQVGEWIDTGRVEFKVTSIISDPELAQKEVDSYNASVSGKQIAALDDESVQFCAMKYSVRYPSDYPMEEYGLVDVALDFTIADEEGAELEGCAETWEIGTLPKGYDFYPGSTFDGEIIYAISKNQGRYYFCHVPDEGEKIYVAAEN